MTDAPGAPPEIFPRSADGPPPTPVSMLLRRWLDCAFRNAGIDPAHWDPSRGVDVNRPLPAGNLTHWRFALEGGPAALVAAGDEVTIDLTTPRHACRPDSPPGRAAASGRTCSAARSACRYPSRAAARSRARPCSRSWPARGRMPPSQRRATSTARASSPQPLPALSDAYVSRSMWCSTCSSPSSMRCSRGTRDARLRRAARRRGYGRRLSAAAKVRKRTYSLRGMAILDRWLPEFNVNEVHAAVLADAPERAIVRALALPAAPDGIVRALFGLRGLHGSSLPIERFLCEVLRFEVVERTPTSAAAVGGARRLRLAISFEAEPVATGSRFVTETRVAAADRRAILAFRTYWLVVGPFSALIRR